MKMFDISHKAGRKSICIIRTMKKILKREGSSMMDIFPLLYGIHCMKCLYYFHNVKLFLKVYLSEDCLLRDHVDIYLLKSVKE